MEPAGYPSFVLSLIVLIGMPFALARPYKAFLLVVFLTSAADATAFTYTRTAFLGPYFNANDACLLIAITAAVSYALFHGRRMQFPMVVKWIIIVLLIGFFQSWYVLGWTYETLRAMRWAIILPAYFIVAATMVDDKEKVRPLLIALFLGAVVSAVEHIVYVRSVISIGQLASEQYSLFRTISFRGPGLWLLLAGLIWLPDIKFLTRPLLFGAGVLFAISILLDQGRTVWISSISVFPVVFLLFKQRGRLLKAFTVPVVLTVLFVGVLLVTYYTSPVIKPESIIMGRLTTLTDEDLRFSSTITRWLAFKREMEEWREGTLIFGRGLNYFGLYYNPPGMYSVGWGHLGHVTVLAQLGLIGLFVYSFYLPFNIVQASRRLWLETSGEVKFLGLLAGLTMLWCCIGFFMSGSFLGQCTVWGIIFGAAWRQAALLREEKI